ncbi:MAG: GNAT family N-acetyltransferase [Phenylobacterium zucineum]|nr:MAG: GNAT family N-acetyltransferase [Phenylobacterium zucineum]
MIPPLADQTLTAGPYSLIPLARGDAPDLLVLFRDPTVVEFMDIEPLANLKGAKDIILWAQEMAERNRGLRWAIRRSGSPTLIGTVGFNTLELDRGFRGEIAYDLAQAYWGQGVMSEILPYVMAFGFETLGLHRLEAMVTVGNLRSCRLLERHGFTLEGQLKDHAFWKGRFWDQLVYGRLAD